jgi:hypothetical protein
MTWQELYVTLAEDLSNSIEDPPRAERYIDNSLYSVLNVNSEGDGSLIETTFFNLTDQLYVYSRRFSYKMEPEVRKYANTMHKFTEKNYGDLTDFVNGLDWTNGCIPYQWWNISEDMGYDTSEWNTCAS